MMAYVCFFQEGNPLNYLDHLQSIEFIKAVVLYVISDTKTRLKSRDMGLMTSPLPLFYSPTTVRTRNRRKRKEMQNKVNVQIDTLHGSWVFCWDFNKYVNKFEYFLWIRASFNLTSIQKKFLFNPLITDGELPEDTT